MYHIYALYLGWFHPAGGINIPQKPDADSSEKGLSAEDAVEFTNSLGASITKNVGNILCVVLCLVFIYVYITSIIATGNIQYWHQ